MQYDEFIGQVQHRARLANSEQAVRATRATLETLGRRLFGGEAKDMAAQLPREIAVYLQPAEAAGERFDLNEFFRRVSQAEGVDLPDAVHHARAVISVLTEALVGGEMAHVRSQLPAEFQPLFEAGSEGPLKA